MDHEQLEALALGDDRDAALAALVPGTEDHDYWRAIHLQHRGELDAVDVILDGWRGRHGHTLHYTTLARRQLLLRADRDLPGHAEQLADELGVELDHQAELEAEAARYPSRLDPALLDDERLLDEALARDRGLGRVTGAALPRLLSRPLDAPRRRELLERLDRTGIPGLIAAVVADLGEKSSRGFGSLAIHHQLTRAELIAVAERVPGLRQDRAWVEALLVRLRPPDHLDWEVLLDERIAYLDELWRVIAALPPTFHSLKAHVLYHRLACDQRADRFDRARLLAYLALPRRSAYARVGWLRELDHAAVANLDHDFSPITGLRPVGDDEALIRAYLAHFLATEDGAGFRDFVEGPWLDRLTAESRLLAGDPDVEAWTTALGTAAATALRDRVDVDLLPTNPRVFGVDDPVALDVALKNVDVLRVRVFRIDLRAYFHRRAADLDISLDLDGLGASWETTLTAAHPPLRRRRERIELPACDRPGTYVIELIGNGKASRALVRKGELRATARPSVAGLAVTIVDERGRPRPGGSIWMGGREYPPRDDGVISLPFSSRPGVQPILLCDGELAVVSSVALPTETYALSAAVLLDRQQLVPGREATALVRASLRVGDVPVTLALLDDPFVELTLIDRTGVPARRRQPLGLGDDRDATVAIAVPEHLSSLTLAIGGRVRMMSEPRTLDLRHEVSFNVGTMHLTPATEALYLLRSTRGWHVSLLGKTGEPRPGRAVTLELRHRLLVDTVDVTLVTDERGVIELGALAGIERFRAATPTGLDQRFLLDEPPPAAPSELALVEGTPLTLPVPLGTADGDWGIFERRASAPAVDHSRCGELAPGLLRVTGLPPGEHTVVAPGAVTRVRIVPAVAAPTAGWASLPRILVELAAAPSALASAAILGDELRIAVANPGPHTRVHVVALPWWLSPAWSDSLDVPRREHPSIPCPPLETRYVSGRDIGDEYRYVLDRQTMPRRPGLMLERPGLLLNPWALRTTTTAVQPAKHEGEWAGGAAPAAAAPSLRGARSFAGSSMTAPSDPAFAAFDFLASSAPVLSNLRPDDRGTIAVPRAALGDARVVYVVCVDPSATTTRAIALDAAPLAVRDLRLAAALPADRHLREDRRLLALPSGAVLAVTDRATSRVELVDTVEKLYGALCALGGDRELAAWDFLPRWPTLPAAERLAIYSRHACHELSLFIYFKDPALFAEVVRPYLANKLHKTFIDHWLLDADLTGYATSRRFADLNAFERALLARRVDRARTSIVRSLAETVELSPPDLERDDRLVAGILAGGALAGEATDLAAMTSETQVPAELARDGGADRAGPEPKPKRLARAHLARSPAGPTSDGRTAGGGADAPIGRDLADRATATPPYRGADKTQEWAEHNWWRRRVTDPAAELIPAARLWRDLANHTRGPFLSEHVVDATASFAASVCALAVVDLPFAAAAHSVRARDAGAEIRVGSPALLALAELAPAPASPREHVLVGQSYFRADDRWEWDGAEQREKYVVGEMLLGVVYQGQVVVTNPTSRPQRLAVLLQVPAGSIAVAGGIATRTERIELAPYATTSLEYGFYFPTAGRFAHYGAQVTRGDELVAAAPSQTLEVVAAPTERDTGSWRHVAQRGSLDELVAYLAGKNLGRVDLLQLAWRLRDRGAFDRITATLADRLVYDDAIWAYALVHGDRPRAREWLAHQDEFLAVVGPLETDLCRVDPIERGRYQHLEYAPLLNARAHRLGERRTVLNQELATQWHALLELIATRPAPLADDWLAAAHYFFTMDRIDDAIRALRRAPRHAVVAQLQHDYLAAYAAAATGDLTAARSLCAPHLAHPVERWRQRFAAMLAMLDEVDGLDPASPPRDQVELAARPALSAHVEDGEVVITHHQLPAATVRFHRMDVELLFSRQPFLGAAGDRFSYIDPGVALTVELRGHAPTRVRIPDELRRRNVVVEVVAGALRHAVTHFAHDLAITVDARYGQVQVRQASTGAPLPATYVKAYARLRGGDVQFFKDGYTDLRGRLDYATLSTGELERVERFALLVAHDRAGASVLEAEPPAR